MNYFEHFNYSLANEDSRVEMQLCQSYSSAVSICGAGGRAFSLIPSGISSLKIIDVSEVQLLYAKFQLELIQQLELPDFLKLMGYEFESLKYRKRLLTSLHFSKEVQDFVVQIPDKKLAKGLIYSGRWENYLLTISRYIRFLLKYDFSDIFVCPDVNSQRDFFYKTWPQKRLQFLMNVIANPRLMNRLLYKGRMAESKSENLISFLENNFRTFFTEHIAKEGLFHQLLFLGEVRFKEAYPPFLWPENYLKIKNFKGDIQFLKKNLHEAFMTEEAQFWSCSDVLSYFSDEDLLKLEGILNARQGSQRLVFRTFLKHPHLSLAKSWLQKDELVANAVSQDVTSLYKFQIFDSL